MAAPVVTSITFDKTSYTVGQVITATVNYSDPNQVSSVYTVNATVTDSAGGGVGTLAGTFTVGSSATASAALTGGETGQVWTKVSDDGKSKAVFTATA